LDKENDLKNGNTSLEYYRVFSTGEYSTKFKTLQHWLETTFTQHEEYKSIFLNEENYDKIALKDFNVHFETKDIYGEIKRSYGKEGFSREDLSANIKNNDEPNSSSFSIKNNKDTEKFENLDIITSGESKEKTFSWKRPDLVEKRVIRALCEIVKDYFNDIAEARKSVSNQEKFTLWDKLIEECFPDTYSTSRLKILGQVCVNSVFGWKFSSKINSLRSINAYQRKQLIKYGGEFRR
jgi:ribosome-binding protein aMBF1 (putative translation factor)